jgi:predicted methyltransferase
MTIMLAEDIAALCLHSPEHWETQLHQTEHRIAILSRWNAHWEGANVLEIGCGQGDFTAVLAEAVGANGHVTAVDPGALTYGDIFRVI